MTGEDRGKTGVETPGDLLSLIRSGEATTRGQLTEATGLARSTVSQRVDALISSGLVIEAGEAESTGGRPPTILGFNDNAGVVLSADFGATHSRIAVTNLGAETLVDRAVEIDIDRGPEDVLGWLEMTFDELLTEAGRSRADVKGIGVGLPGPVDFDRGMAVHPPIMAGWHEYLVSDRLGESYGVPVLVDNDVNIMALGEQWVMSPRIDDFIYLKVGTGIGSGLVLGGRIHRGAHGAAGDIGHVQATNQDVMCRCGNTGCLEAVAGGAALAAQLAASHDDVAGSRDVVRLVREGRNDAARAVREAGRLIGQVLASTVNLLNPALIIVGGDMAAAEQQLLAGIREVVYRRSTALSTTDLQIKTSKLGDRAGVTGAAAMVIDHLLQPEAIAMAIATSGGLA
ncbi:MAG TPA: ROK family transcriptional regulator [Acidimicrobiia bacterium]|nr:ROK family transcriptional regulator [Acidimicrobiia bacterium]